MPRVSIGLPVYNGEKYLREAIDSVLAQTIEDFELIISDNASTDHTEEICRDYVSRDRRIRYYRNKRNLGASRNFNRAFELSKGCYFKWLAHDDLCAPNFLNACLKALEKNREAVLAFPNTKVIDASGDFVRNQKYTIRTNSRNPRIRFRSLILANHIITEVFGVVRSEILKRTSLIGNYPSSDRILLAELSLHGPFELVQKPLFLHREHEQRSHKALTSPHSRVEWFDTARAGKIALPSWRVIKECLNVIRRSPLVLKEKIECYIEVARWGKRNRSRLHGDLLIGATQLFQWRQKKETITPTVCRKVLYLAPSRTRSEQITEFTFLDEEIQALAEAGIEAYVLSPYLEKNYIHGQIHMKRLPDGKPFPERLRTLFFLIRHIKSIPMGTILRFRSCFHNVRIEKYASELVRKNQIDVIHSHFGFPGGFGGLLVKADTSRPLVASIRGMDVLMDASINYGLRLSPSFDKSIRALLKRADRTVCFSDFIEKKAIALGASPKTTETILKGVNLERFKDKKNIDDLRKELGVKSEFMILAVAGLIPRKGITYIIEALGHLGPKYDYTFVICGDGPEENNLKKLAAAHSLEKRTRFAGRITRNQIPKYFAACDIFILPSIHEAAGNVLLEAMASGRPVITTYSGGPPEYVKDRGTGFVVPTKDPKAISEKIRILLDDEVLRGKLGEEGRTLAEQCFSYSRMIDDILAVYKKVVNQHHQ